MNEQNTTSSPQNVRKDFKDCAADKVADFIVALEKSGAFIRKGYIPVNDASHFERFSYAQGSEHISIVYDTKARMLSVTAKDSVAADLEALFKGRGRDKITKAIGKDKAVSDAPRKLKISDKLMQKQGSASGQWPVANGQFSKDKERKSSIPSPDSGVRGQGSGIREKDFGKQPPSPESRIPNPEYKNGFVIKNVTREAYEGIYKRGKSLKGVTAKAVVENAGKPGEVVTAEFTGAQKQKAYLRFAPRSQTLALQGKRSALYAEIQLLLTGNTDYNTAITSHIKSAGESDKKNLNQPQRPASDSLKKSASPVAGASVAGAPVAGAPAVPPGAHVSVVVPGAPLLPGAEGANGAPVGSAFAKPAAPVLKMPCAAPKREKKPPPPVPESASATEKRLRKLLPAAIDFLSDQSKIDLSIGLIDIYNEFTRLSDYSVLLVPPYRGLERLIYDLQTAEKISVKMIGQAFEKRDDGSYCLKSGYRKKIDSVVYNEVMSALYTEYFKERHNLTHSDNSDEFAPTRAVRDLKDAKMKFDRLLSVIDYNCKKLKEIGFKTK
ncbi:MAG: hypothetical protein FWD58_02375 [Firmicutes bacterium]|nr:hypothetical protein [Bacillota bacterium]